MLAVSLLEQCEGHLLLAIFRNQAFAVVSVLQFWDVPSRRAKVHENPWSGSAKLGGLPQNLELVLEHEDLLLFGPALVDRPMVAGLRLSAELAHQHRLWRE